MKYFFKCQFNTKQYINIYECIAAYTTHKHTHTHREREREKKSIKIFHYIYTH